MGVMPTDMAWVTAVWAHTGRCREKLMLERLNRSFMCEDISVQIESLASTRERMKPSCWCLHWWAWQKALRALAVG